MFGLKSVTSARCRAVPGVEAARPGQDVFDQAPVRLALESLLVALDQPVESQGDRSLFGHYYVVSGRFVL